MYKNLFKTWYSILYPNLISNNYFNKLITFLNKEYKTKQIYPKKQDVFNCFKLTNYHDLKVVILGNEPYFNKATGLAFANKDNIRESVFSPSLLKIKDCIERDIKDGLYLDFDPTLEKWAKQGILLLNTSLTVVNNKPYSHEKYWNKFTKNVIKTINDEKTSIIFLLWGPEAREYKDLINHKRHYILEYTNPIYAVNNNIDWKCPHFKEVNNILEQNNGREFIVNW